MLELKKTDYPVEERNLLDSLEIHFRDWKSDLKKSKDPLVRNHLNSMTFDGFYPYYTRQPKRILFMGRDAYGLAGLDYIKVFYDIYRRSKRIGDPEQRPKHLNQHLFHARMLHISWGLLNGMPDWEEIPWADKVGDDFGSENGISFAFLNLGKLRRNSDVVSADFPMIDAFCEESKKPRDFVSEQIELLAPDVVISMNLGERLKHLGQKEQETTKAGEVDKYRLRIKDHECLLLDCWHFSATGKKHIEHFYRPICDALKESGWS